MEATKGDKWHLCQILFRCRQYANTLRPYDGARLDCPKNSWRNARK